MRRYKKSVKNLFSPHFGYYLIMVLFLYAPVAILIMFSFNEGTTLMFPLKGFTFKWYQDLLKAEELIKALRNSVLVGLGSSFAATVLGTMAALAITRFRFQGRDFFITVGTLPLVIPYVVMGVALLIVFHWIGIPLSLWTVGSAHAMINIPYVMLIVSARLAGFESNLEDASMDLGATYWGTLFRITLPICAPALLAGFLSSFTTSFDEFALSFFLTGTQNTLPIYLYSQLRFPSRLPLVLALAAIIISVSFVTMLVTEQLRRVGQPVTEKR
jgi:spermidine/putrescine transport system permease protein